MGPHHRRGQPGRLRPSHRTGGLQRRQGGVVALVKTVAAELEGTNITSNAILPAVIDTAATRAALPYADYVNWPKPPEIAALVDFLSSPASGVINGAAIPAYGQT